MNIRGTSGSGKSTIVHQILQYFEATEIVDTEHFRKPKVVGYKLLNKLYMGQDDPRSLPLFIVGEYKNDCGGCDTITRTNIEGWKGMDYIEFFIREAAQHGHVLFEGLLITGIWGRFQKISQDFPGQYVFGFMDTPIEKCFERIQIRNGGKPIKEENTRGKYRAMEIALEKARNFNERSMIINHENAYDQVLDLFADEGWVGVPKDVPFPSAAEIVGTSPSSQPV